MKSICSLLILVLAVHSQCGVQCVTSDIINGSHTVAPTAEKPTCHEEPGNPKDSSRPDDGNGNPCGQEQVIEARNTSVLKCVLLWTGSASPLPVSLHQPVAQVTSGLPDGRLPTSVSSADSSVLRI